jgi:ribosomal-protein-serine acetyltransferase
MFCLRIDDELDLALIERRHAEAVHALARSNREHLLPWLPWAEKLDSIDGTIEFIDGAVRQFERGDGFSALVRWKGKPVGAVGLHYISTQRSQTEIGYWMDRAHWGRGLMTRCVRGLLAHVFDELGLNRVEIRCDVDNAASRRIPEKLGFRQEGVLRDASLLAAGRRGDLVVYGLLAREWRAATP